MANRRLPASEDALELNQIDSNTYITSRYKEGTEQDSDKAIPFKYFQSSPVAICSSTADAVSKIAQVENFPDFALENGREVVVYFENGNIAENPSLNVSNTGSYPIAMETITDATGIKCESGTFYRMTYCDVTSNGVRIRKWIAGASIVDKLDKADVEQTISDSESKIPSSNAVNNALLTKNYEGWGICSAVADAEEKTVTDEVITQLVAGQKIVVKFENANTFGTCVGTDSNVIANGVKLKLNDFPAYPIRVGGENAGEGFVNANDVHTFVFDGTVWNDLTADVIYQGSTTNGNYTKKRSLLIEQNLYHLSYTSSGIKNINLIIPINNYVSGHVNYAYITSDDSHMLPKYAQTSLPSIIYCYIHYVSGYTAVIDANVIGY